MAWPDHPLISARFPYLPLTLTVGEQTATIEGLLDTGFDGAVVVPAHLVTNGSPPDSYLLWTLADGSLVQAPAYLGTAKARQL